MKVIYIGGWMRSGTTLLSDLLGAQPGVLNAGEISGLWAAAARGGICACGERIVECPVWGAAISLVREELAVSDSELDTFGAVIARTYRTRKTLRLLRTFSTPTQQWPLEFQRATAATQLLLSRALAISGKDVLVDSSKLVPGLLFHAQAEDTDVRVLHILREPMAVAASELRTAHAQPGNLEFVPPGSGVATSALRWSGANVSLAMAAKATGTPYRRVQYEDMVTRPAVVLPAIMGWLEEEFDSGTVVDNTARLGASHAAVGNPVRRHGSQRSISLDDRWRSELGLGHKAAVCAMTLPVRVLLRTGIATRDNSS